MSSTAALSAADTTNSSTSSSGSSQQSQNLTSQDTFLQLLVAQLKNQDPEQPTDGTAFVTELAQFTTLQQDTESATDLDTLVSDVGTLMGTGSTPSTSGNTPSSDAVPANVTNAIHQ
jgi:flagellar basal-body rod modification protein FlgD